MVEIPNDFKAGDLTYQNGVYKLRTMTEAGQAKIENNIGQEILTSAKNLVTAEFYKKK